MTYDALDRPVEAGGQELVYAPDGSKIAVMGGQTLTRAEFPLPGGAEAVFTAPDQVGVTVGIHVGTLAAIGEFNVPGAVTGLSTMAGWDLGGAYVINSECSAEVYGPGE